MKSEIERVLFGLRKGLVALLVVPLLAGCGSIMVRSSNQESAVGCVYWGVRQNLGYLQKGASIGAPHPGVIRIFRYAVPALDLPGSFIVDTLLLPIDIIATNPYKTQSSKMATLLDYSGCDKEDEENTLERSERLEQR